MGNQPSVLSPADGEEDANSRQNLRDGRNARVLDLPLDASASVSASESLQSDSKLPPETSGQSNSSDQQTAASAASPAAPRRRVTEFYDVQSELLGRGHYAVVNRGRCRRTGRPVAIKKIKRFLDLKPENVLLSTPDDQEAVVKVADFGLAKVFTGTSLKTKCGTWGYSAPEMISGSGSTFGYDDKVDSWSLGTILYILLCGYHPFDPEGERSDNQMIASIKACSFEFDDDGWATISEEAKDLVRHLLVLDPDDRFSMAQVLEHPWIAGSSVTPASELPLSPSIHHELAKFREHTKQKVMGYDAT
ncbi:hypothetical protein BBJ29_004368 [Phytophthora kernoviae]|uniref:Protein kinase domain-containing protein n=1 Tax=Phytophthora kernoviae TaxID=325452 RepID=A0A421G1X2_9STRA|nr:hypothetical protein BBJ29_004368 [Phytophthora kernoviae]